MKKKYITISLILILLNLVLSGCLDFFIWEDGTITYESHPTAIKYTISYGYLVDCRGNGQYNLKYYCNLPEVIKGIISNLTALNDEYEQKILATFNTVYSWEIINNINKEYNLGLTANVEAESYMVSDLNGVNAKTIQQINNLNTSLVDQYTKSQSNDTTIFINPDDKNIQTIANNVLNSTGTNNAFLVAKELFKWLKQETTYQIHSDDDNDVQPSSFTVQYRTGDCDDLSFLYISLCRTIRIPARFIRGFLIEKNNAIPHAWVEVYVGTGVGRDGWITVECAGVSGNIDIEVHQNFALETTNHLRTFIDDGSDESMNTSITGFYSLYGENRIIEAEGYVKVNNYYIIKSNQLEVDENGYRTYK